MTSRTHQEITLRAVEPTDLDFLYIAENDTRAWSASATVAPWSRLLLQQYIENYRADIYSDRQLRLIAIDAAQRAIGIVDLYDFDPRNSRAGVGIYIAPSMRSKGYGQEALKALCFYAQMHLNINNLYAFIAEDNEASRRLFSRCGFTHTATLPHWIKSAQGTTSAAIVMQRVKEVE